MASDDHVGFMYSCSSCYDPESDSDSISSVVEKLEITNRFPSVLRKPVPSASMRQLTPVATQDRESDPTLHSISRPPTASIITTTTTLRDSTHDEDHIPQLDSREGMPTSSAVDKHSIESPTAASTIESQADQLVPANPGAIDSDITPALKPPTAPAKATLAPALAPVLTPPAIGNAQDTATQYSEEDHLDGLRKAMQLSWDSKNEDHTNTEKLVSKLESEPHRSIRDQALGSGHNVQHLWAIPGVLDSYYGPESSSYIYRRPSGKVIEESRVESAVRASEIERRTGAQDTEPLPMQRASPRNNQIRSERKSVVEATRKRQESSQKQLQPTRVLQRQEDNDDIPFGILYKQPKGKDSRPALGLIARQELEDTEPLNRRRERLFGSTETTKKAVGLRAFDRVAELETPVVRTEPSTFQTADMTSRAQPTVPEALGVQRLSPSDLSLSRASDTSLPFTIPTEPSAAPSTAASPAEPPTVSSAVLPTPLNVQTPSTGSGGIKTRVSRATGTHVFGVDPCLSVEYAGYELSQIPFFIDNEVTTIGGRIPFVFGKCIEVILQSQSTYTDKHTWRRGMIVISSSFSARTLPEWSS